jgi:nitric oxide reductase activation protein
MLTELLKRPEEIKLLFIVSDGLPADYGSNEDGVKHLQEVLASAQKAGVLTFAAALNEDISSIKGIYGENMFEITDLARMPRALLTVMKRFVK